MFGWEFPPYNSGGLGTACFGLTKGLSQHGVSVNFVIPKAPKGMKAHHGHVNLTVASQIRGTIEIEGEENINIEEVESLLVPYLSEQAYIKRYHELMKMGKATLLEADDEEDANVKHGHEYGRNLMDEVHRYAQKAGIIAATQPHDVIHAHDWMTYKAGIMAKKISQKPFVAHIHATEFDRTGGNCNQVIYNAEREGFHAADKILAVSNLTRNTLIQHYGVSPHKVDVCHNAIEFKDKNIEVPEKKNTEEKNVLFLGRITLQKGPEYFVEAARIVADHMDNVKFVVAGSGDMEQQMIDHAYEKGLQDKMIFTGFLRGDDVDRAFKMADLYVMPSVSEPFGLTPLESMRNGTPVLISKTSGVSEVLDHALKVDFWDIKQMASKIIAALHYPTLHETLTENGKQEVKKFDWKIPAALCIKTYKQLHGWSS